MLLIRSIMVFAFLSVPVAHAEVSKNISANLKGEFETKFNQSAQLCLRKSNCAAHLLEKISRFRGTCVSNKKEAFDLFLEVYPPGTVTLEGSIKNLSVDINYAYSEGELNKKSKIALTSDSLPSWVEPLLPDFINSLPSYKPIFTGDAYFFFSVIDELVYGNAVVRGNSSHLMIKMSVPNSEVTDFSVYCSLYKF